MLKGPLDSAILDILSYHLVSEMKRLPSFLEALLPFRDALSCDDFNDNPDIVSPISLDKLLALEGFYVIDGRWC